MSDSDSFIKLKKELKTLFRSEDKDLNFGIYRIMNQLNKEIDEFIDKELPKIVEEKILELQKYKTKDIDAELEELRKSLEKARIDPLSSPAYKELLEGKKENRSINELEDDVYNNLVRFFSRYYQDGDVISKFYFNDQTYLIPYDGSEVELYWPTKDMYFVKTSDNYQRFSFTDENINLVFKLVATDEEKGNQKQKDLYFDIDNIEKIDYDFVVSFKRIISNELIDSFGKNKNEKQNKLNERISQTIKENTGIKTNILKNLEKFQRRYTEDYFIHKNLKEFLQKQLVFFINQELLSIDAIFTKNGIIREDKKIIAIVFRDISLNIIEKLSLLENLKKRIWEKKKFVLESNYVITLDKIEEYCGAEFLEKIIPEILENSKQLSEWTELYGIIITSKNDLLVKDPQQKLTDTNIPEWKKLPVDTKYFSTEFKWKLLSNISNLEDNLNGILIHSENWQALNLIEEKYREKIKCCYIDPPYNTVEESFNYKNNYKHSSWDGMINDRLSKSLSLISENGVNIVAIDDEQFSELNEILKTIFPHHLGTICVESNPRGRTSDAYFAVCHEYLLYYEKIEGESSISLRDLSEEEIKVFNYEDEISKYRLLPLRKSGAASFRKDRPKQFYPIYINPSTLKISLKKEENFIELLPLDSEGKERVWKIGTIKCAELINKGEVLAKVNTKGEITLLQFDRIKSGRRIKTIWKGPEYDGSAHGTILLTKMFGQNYIFSYPKSLYSVEKAIDCVLEPSDYVLDYFAGSGTTAHAAILLNSKKLDEDVRKYILVEMADYFNYVTLSRVKKILYSLTWDKGKPKEMDSIGGFFKYHELEQYEDALENIQFKQLRLDSFDNYGKLLQYYLEGGIDSDKSKNFLGVDTEKEFLDLKIKILNKDGTTRDQNVDLIETFNYLIGIEILQMKKLSNGQIDYYVITGMVKDNSTIIIWRDPKVDKEKDKEFINKLLQEKSYNDIYVNSDCLIKNYKNIYDEMRKRLW
ncbi:MAG TPA: DNA methyltransferase [Methanofastidiosum sp.]|nr:DNA methyltransferase [Methanofastidiosum sp.]